MARTKILYLQLPLLDNDVKTDRENFLFAGAYLDHALQQSDEAGFYESIFPPVTWDELDTAHLVDEILNTGAEILSCTLYLWNIERTLHLAEQIKKRNPNIRISVGGPETAKTHPLLFSPDSPFDAVTTGEGESVHPRLLHAWRTGDEVNIANLALKTEQGWIWGTEETIPVNLIEAQPTPETIMQCVQNRPVVYLETVRGCPLICSYCRYYQLHTGLRKLSTKQVLDRIKQFRKLGAKEIRFVDPTFNARPKFTEFLTEIAELNTDQHISFFAEIRSDTLTSQQAELMKKANFTAVEVGVQSIDPDVLRNVTRPVSLKKTEKGIQALCDAGVHVVLDIMYGLPGQTADDVQQSLKWALQFGDAVQVQCMQTLVLPGTVLRSESDKWGFIHATNPPYAIQQTACLNPDEIRDIELFLDNHPDLPADPVTPRFVGRRLTGLFKEQIRIPAAHISATAAIPGKSNRRTVQISGADLFSDRRKIAGLIQKAIDDDPDGLWQFVLIPDHEEPLDLLKELAETIRNQPSHILDRFASASAFQVTVSRRLYVRTNKQISSDWANAAEELLREYFG